MPHTFIARSPAAQALLAQLQAHADAAQPLWIVGASGSGRGHAARWLHQQGPRAPHPCLEIDCASLDPGHISSWICGAMPGSVRGLFQMRPSWFETTQGGTLVLQGPERLPAAEQQLLAQALRDRQVMRLGTSMALPINSRLILVSDTAPHLLAQQGRLLHPLAAALRGPEVCMPSLADRREDVPDLARALMAHHARMLQRPMPPLSDAALEALCGHDWPDNLRELDTCMQSLLIRHQGQVVSAADLGLPTTTDRDGGRDPLLQLQSVLQQLLTSHPGQVHTLVQAAMFEQAHAHTQGHQIKAAQVLGVSRNVLRTRLIELGILQARG